MAKYVVSVTAIGIVDAVVVVEAINASAAQDAAHEAARLLRPVEWSVTEAKTGPMDIVSTDEVSPLEEPLASTRRSA